MTVLEMRNHGGWGDVRVGMEDCGGCQGGDGGWRDGGDGGLWLACGLTSARDVLLQTP